MSDRVAALILAAGESRRMGRPKPLLDWAGKPLLQHQIDELLRAGCDPVLAVLGHAATEITAALRCRGACRTLVNDAYTSGRASSMRAGARAIPDDAAAIIVASVDTPLQAATVRALLAAWRLPSAQSPSAQPAPTPPAPTRPAIVVPRFQTRNGHPTLFDGRLLEALRGVQEASQGLRALRRAHAAATHFLDLDDPLVALNLNTPQAYRAARAAFGRDAPG